MPRRFQFSLRALLVAVMLAAASSLFASHSAETIARMWRRGHLECLPADPTGVLLLSAGLGAAVGVLGHRVAVGGIVGLLVGLALFQTLSVICS